MLDEKTGRPKLEMQGSNGGAEMQGSQGGVEMEGSRPPLEMAGSSGGFEMEGNHGAAEMDARGPHEVYELPADYGGSAETREVETPVETPVAPPRTQSRGARTPRRGKESGRWSFIRGRD